VCQDSVYVASRDGALYALDAETGVEQWRFATGGEVFGAAVYEGKYVWLTSGDGNLYGVRAGTAEKVHELNFGTPIVGPPALWSRTLVFPLENAAQAVDAFAGTIGWRAGINRSTFNVPKAAPGQALLQDRTGDIIALDLSTGDIAWQYRARSDSSGALGVGDDMVFMISGRGELHAVSRASGRRNWVRDLGCFSLAPPACLGQYVYALVEGPALAALDVATGEMAWQVPITVSPTTPATPIVAENGLVGLSPTRGQVQILNASTGRQFCRFEAPSAGVCWIDLEPRATSARLGGTVFVGLDNGTVQAVKMGQ